MEKSRVQWLDVLKFIGAFEIYLGHFTNLAGQAYAFVFTHHVALFFFAAGCACALKRESNYISLVKNKVKSILIPFFVFGLVSILILTISTNLSMWSVFSQLKMLLQGAIRNRFEAQSLWFLTALFSMFLIFGLISNLKKPLLLMIGIALNIIFTVFMYDYYPFAFFNFDSVARYSVFFIVGFVFFDAIDKLIHSKNKLTKALYTLTSFGTIVYSALLFLGKDIFDFAYTITGFYLIYNMIQPLIVIWALIYISTIFSDVKLFNTLGQNTLYLCGSEYMIKAMVPWVIALVGTNLALPNPFAVYMYTFILLLLANEFIVPKLKYLVLKANGFFEINNDTHIKRL